jgi:hypothetical protein
MSSMFIFAMFIVPPVKDQIHLAQKEITWYVGKVVCHMAFADKRTVICVFNFPCGMLNSIVKLSLSELIV